MSSIHHLSKDDVESNVWTNSSDEISESHNGFVPIEDLQYNGNDVKAFGKHLQTIDILSNGSVIIASDDIQSLNQCGILNKYDRIEDVPQLPILSLNPGFGGICNVIPLKDKSLICGFDSGTIFKLNEGLEEVLSVTYHSDHICRVSVDRLQSRSVSGGYDKSLLVLDLNTFMPIKSYNCAHSSTIWDNVFNPIDGNLVLTSSRDKNVLLWDLRKERPASKVKTIETEPTTLCWSSEDISNAYIGTDSGEIMLLDIRNPKPEQMAQNWSKRRIHRIKNVLNGKAIAICSDDNNFLVLDSKSLKSIYENKTSHSGWVRGVAEHNQLLYTVGRDSRLICHSDFTSELSSVEMSDTSIVS